MLLLIVPTVLTALIFFYVKLKKQLQFWEEKGVPYLKPWPFVGNMGLVAMGTRNFIDVLHDAYKQFPGHRYFGFYKFNVPTLVIRDLDLLKQICIKNFDKFTDHGEFLPKEADPFWNEGLFAKEGKDWHDMRIVLSPAFTSSKMRSMFCLMTECAQNFVHHFQKQSGIVTLEMRDAFTRYGTDVVASCAFGMECDSLKDTENEFYITSKNAFNFTGWRGIKFFGSAISPTLMKLFKISFFDGDIQDFFRRVINETIKYRNESKTIRPDLIHLLREAQKGRLRHEDDHSATDADHLIRTDTEYSNRKIEKRPEITDEDITIQSVLFFFGSYDTVSSLLCSMAYELAVHPDIQQRLIGEVDKVWEECNGKLTYDALVGMKYLHMVTSETLRLRPPGTFMNRKCVKPFTIEPVLPHEKPLDIDVGTDIMVSIVAIQLDPINFPNPEEFDPERFSEENRGLINSAAYIPFGMGPRNCIANRFALVEAKVIIFYILTRFQFVPVEKTQIPLVMCTKSVVPSSSAGYWLGLKPRTTI